MLNSLAWPQVYLCVTRQAQYSKATGNRCFCFISCSADVVHKNIKAEMGGFLCNFFPIHSKIFELQYKEHQ